MLSEAEWEPMSVALSGVIGEIQRYRAEHGVGLDEAFKRSFGIEALDPYERMTGMRETNVNAIWHHRLSMYGPPCAHCGKPLRTPQAKLCAACGAMRAREVAAIVFGVSRMQVLSALSDALGPLLRQPQSEDAGRSRQVETDLKYHADTATVVINEDDGALRLQVHDSAQWPSSLAFGRYLARHTHGRVYCHPGEDGAGSNGDPHGLLEVSD